MSIEYHRMSGVDHVPMVGFLPKPQGDVIAIQSSPERVILLAIHMLALQRTTIEIPNKTNLL